MRPELRADGCSEESRQPTLVLAGSIGSCHRTDYRPLWPYPRRQTLDLCRLGENTRGRFTPGHGVRHLSGPRVYDQHEAKWRVRRKKIAPQRERFCWPTGKAEL